MTPKSQPTPVARLSVVGLVVAAAGIMIQYVSGVGSGTLGDPGEVGGFAGAVI